MTNKQYNSIYPKINSPALNTINRWDLSQNTTLKTIMPYYCFSNAQTAGAFFVRSAIRLSDLYDPQPGVGNTQPRGYAALSSMYGSYSVKGMQYTLKFQNGTSTTPLNVTVYIGRESQATQPTFPYSQIPGSITKQCTIGGGAHPMAIFTGYIDVPATKAKFGGSSNTAFSYQSPDTEYNLYCLISTLDGLAAPMTVFCTYEVKYYANWNQPNFINGP